VTPAQEDKRGALLNAAVRLFAQKGYHDCRVSDIAAEAGVAHGLLYHYFSSKEEVLRTVVADSWQQFAVALRRVEEEDVAAPEQLEMVVRLVLGAWQELPDLIRVVLREFARDPVLKEDAEQVLASLERIVRRGQERGELRADVDTRFAATVVYGALEEVLDAWAEGRAPEDVDRAQTTVTRLLCGGLVAA
jgi:TetR/AcrR family fatty acid metabolism transcriptional regulator